MRIITFSPKQTSALGRRLAKEIIKIGPIPSARGGGATAVALQGELGSGKTTFLQGFAKGLGVKEKILSPTFVIIKKFHIINDQNQPPRTSEGAGQTAKFKTFYHIDCYKLEDPKELYQLGWKDIVSDPQNVVVIEWADRVKKAMPKSALWIKFRWREGSRAKLHHPS